MKRFSIVMLMVAATMAFSAAPAQAQILGGLLKQTVKKVTEDASDAKDKAKEKVSSVKEQTSGSLTNLAGSLLGGLSNNNGLSSLADGAGSLIKGWLTGSTELTAANLAGTWTYAEPAVKLQSDNLLAQAGGTLLEGTVEEKLKEQLEKVGLTAGSVSLTLNTDSSYTLKLGKVPQMGKYSLNGDKMKLQSLLLTIDATATLNGDNLQLAVDADKILKVIGALGNLGSNSTAISALNSLVNSYDGLQVGMKFTKTSEEETAETTE